MVKHKSLFGFLFEKIKKSIENRKLRKSPVYKSAPEIQPLKLGNLIQGNFNSFIERMENDSLIMLVFGKRGSGKSSLGFRLLENIYGKTKRDCFVLGVGSKLLPHWISSIEDIQTAPNGSIILVDEGAVSFGSRNSMKLKNKELTNLLATARHKSLTLIFITQNTGLIDKNVLKLADTLFIKEGSLLQVQMERPEIKKFYEKAKKHFDNLKNKEKYSYVIDSGFEGIIIHTLPSFWSDSISKNRNN